MATPNITSLLSRCGLVLPPHDYETFTYIAAGAADDDDISILIGYRGGSSGIEVGRITFTYVGSTNNIATAALTMPTANY